MEKKKVFEVIKKRLKIRHIMFLIVLLAFNSYAWFIYATKVSGSLSAHITSWNVEFQSGVDDISTNLKLDIERIYPGMDDYVKEISVRNKGEVKAQITYEIKKIKILGETYEIDEETTSDDLQDILENNFPFKLKINIDNNTVLNENTSSSFNISLTWPFESGNDALDTYWGNKAYEYYSLNSTSNCIEIELEIKAMQME